VRVPASGRAIPHARSQRGAPGSLLVPGRSFPKERSGNMQPIQKAYTPRDGCEARRREPPKTALAPAFRS
jgi:hypothetical protein